MIQTRKLCVIILEVLGVYVSGISADSTPGLASSSNHPTISVESEGRPGAVDKVAEFGGQELLKGRIWMFDDFLDDEQVDRLVSLVNMIDESKYSPCPMSTAGRSCADLNLQLNHNPSLLTIREKVKQLWGITEEEGHPLRNDLPVMRFAAGAAEIKTHNDALLAEDGIFAPIDVTMAIYLTDVPEELGGHLTFPTPNITIQSKRGRMVAFLAVNASGDLDHAADHYTAPTSEALGVPRYTTYFFAQLRQSTKSWPFVPPTGRYMDLLRQEWGLHREGRQLLDTRISLDKPMPGERSTLFGANLSMNGFFLLPENKISKLIQ